MCSVTKVYVPIHKKKKKNSPLLASTNLLLGYCALTTSDMCHPFADLAKPLHLLLEDG